MSGTSMNLKEQIISLNLELEDKVKVGELLQRRLERARDDFTAAQHDVESRFAPLLQEERERHRAIADALTEKTQALVEEKSRLLEELKARMSEAQQTERDVQAETRSLYREAERDLELDKKRFRQGHDERLQKYISSKAEEIRESTNKAMEPEFFRLQSMHERETAEVHASSAAEERKLIETFKSRAESEIDEERALAKDELRYTLQSLQDKLLRETETRVREHQQTLRLLADEAERESERLQSAQQEKIQRLRSANNAEIAELQRSAQQRMLDLKKSHALHMESVAADHAAALRRMRRQNHEERLRTEQALKERSACSSSSSSPAKRATGRQTVDVREKEKERPRVASASAEEKERDNAWNGGLCVDLESDSDGEGKEKDLLDASCEEIARPPLSPSRVVSRFPEREKDGPPSLLHPRDLAQQEKQSVRPSSARSGSSHSLTTQSSTRSLRSVRECKAPTLLSVSFSSPALQEKFEATKKEAESKRDRQIQSEIRALEAETIKLERELRMKQENERHSIQHLQRREEENLTVCVQQLTSNVADLVQERESLFLAVQQAQLQEERARKEAKELRKELQVFKDGLAAQRVAVREKEDEIKRKVRETLQEQEPALRELQRRLQNVQDQMKEEEQAWKKQTKGIEQEHAKELAKLDSSVKSDVAQREEKIAQLREDIAVDKSKLDKLIAMVAKYSGSNKPSSSSSSKHERREEAEEASHGDRDGSNRASSAKNRPFKTATYSAARSISGRSNNTDDVHSVRSAGTATTASYSRYSAPLHRTVHK